MNPPRKLEEPAGGRGSLGDAKRLGLAQGEDGGGLGHGDRLPGQRSRRHQFAACLVELPRWRRYRAASAPGRLDEDTVIPGRCCNRLEPPPVEFVRGAVGDDHQPDTVGVGDQPAKQPERGRVGPLRLFEKDRLRPPAGGGSRGVDAQLDGDRSGSGPGRLPAGGSLETGEPRLVRRLASTTRRRRSGMRRAPPQPQGLPIPMRRRDAGLARRFV